jgi:DNA polymerase I-like protein with 3'-5' exonuclease and polymerase domains
MIALDTETTGLDWAHGAKPYLVTIYQDDGQQTYYQWPVNPLTREPMVDSNDLDEIASIVFDADYIVGQNIKFDVTMLGTLSPEIAKRWPWDKTHDTLMAGHLLASNRPHNLTDMCIEYLGIDIESHEKALHEACEKARRYCRTHHPDWAIAKKGRTDMPSAKEACWKLDMWLPQLLADEMGQPTWKTLITNYANTDSEATLLLWKVMEKELHKRKLWAIYQERMKLLPVAYKMEHRGVTVSKVRLGELTQKYTIGSLQSERKCVDIARKKNYDLALPKSGNNQSLHKFIFDVLQFPPIKVSDKTGNPSLDKACLDEYENSFEDGSSEQQFIEALMMKRRQDTAVQYMEGYKRFWRVYQDNNWCVLHPNTNPTGTDTLRWSFNNPNTSNFSKQEAFNLRYCFGPATGREWWSMDYKNVELRIPAYESGEKDLIEVFERPNDPPYYGSYHLVIFDLLHPEIFKEHGKACKEIYESTLYQWIKNANFAVIYGAQEKKADATYRVPGAYQKVRYRFPKIAALNDRWKAYADKHGQIQTIPDKEVDPNIGYPLLCTRTEFGRIMPTIPFNYHVSGTAMWITGRAMIKCSNLLDTWNDELASSQYFMPLQVHDELVFDTPKQANPKIDPKRSNLWRAKQLQGLMESIGDAVGIPTPVDIEYHADNYSTGVKL